MLLDPWQFDSLSDAKSLHSPAQWASVSEETQSAAISIMATEAGNFCKASFHETAGKLLAAAISDMAEQMKSVPQKKRLSAVEYWKTMQHASLVLHVIQMYLAIPSGNAEPEWVNSLTGSVVSPKRTQLSVTHVENLTVQLKGTVEVCVAAHFSNGHR